MPRCPRCARKFMDRRAVLSHMNQPLGSCQTHTQELSTIAQELEQYHRRKRTQCTSYGANLPQREQDNVGTMDIDDSFLEQEDWDISVEHEAAPFVERFEGAAEEFGPGSTFMDNFDKDTYAYERVYNLYYPFASRNEWELASFLLRSNLSMALVNKFLSLNLVSLRILSILVIY
jgi:hypothetical protein